jgi:hypothetical protein
MPREVAAPIQFSVADIGEESLGEPVEGIDVELPGLVEEEVGPELGIEPEGDVDAGYDFLPEDVVRARRLSDRIERAWLEYGGFERAQESVEAEFGRLPEFERAVGGTRSLELSTRWEGLQGEKEGVLFELRGLHDERLAGGESVRRLTSGDPEEGVEHAGVEGMGEGELVARELVQGRLFGGAGSSLPALSGESEVAGGGQDVAVWYYRGLSVSLGRPLTTDDVSEPMQRELSAKPDIVEELKVGGFISYALYRRLGGRE